MKVLMIGSNLRVPGGITRVVKNYIEAGIEKKVNFKYFSTYLGSNNLVNIIYYFFQYVLLSINLHLGKGYDIAHIHMSYRGSFIRKKHVIDLLSRKGIPVILHMHGSQFKEFYHESNSKKQQQIRETLNKVNVIIALGNEWKIYYESICETEVISVDNAVFPKQPNNTSKEKIYITTMGVLSKRKGTYDLIKVGERLKGKIDSKYKIVLAGNGDLQKVKNEIKSLGLEDLFIIPGWISNQNEIEEIYRKSIIYILPSYNEGMPMSILEAMSYGIPVISTNVGSIASVVESENGYTVEPGDINDLTNKILILLNDEEKIGKMSLENTRKIKEKYNIYTSLDELIQVYQDVDNRVNKKENIGYSNRS